ncbi:MAG: ABC transporter permease subunit [Candidatus Acidiferrales bacterium]
MKIWALAVNTFRAFLRDKLIIISLIIFAGALLLMISPLLMISAVRAVNSQSASTLAFEDVAGMIYLVSAAGSLLAAWAGADSVGTELKSGTILAVMARPVERWRFLVGKFCGVMLLMAAWTVTMTGLAYFLLWLGGLHATIGVWELLAYALVRYAVYAAIAMMLVTFLQPVIAWVITIGIAIMAAIVGPSAAAATYWKPWIRLPLYAILPSTGLLSESRFMSLTQASLKPMTWLQHATALSYGLDYALICLLLAMWSFHYRSLRRD